MLPIAEPSQLKGLLRRHDRAAPRYTSYPTADRFEETFQEADFIQELRSCNESEQPRDLSLYIHLPFCSSVCFYCGCNVTFTADRQRPRSYLNMLEREMDQLTPYLKTGRQVRQLHLGGGTPTFLHPEELVALSRTLKSRFPFHPEAELSVEVDPRVTHPEHLQRLAEQGSTDSPWECRTLTPLCRRPSTADKVPS
ncbi:MAG: radical SAM protein [Blastochloris sp.]|nr:radical SAM protein [Blastochloris sp.]